MKNLLALITICLTAISCSHYQYAVVTNGTESDSIGSIITDNDTLRISYTFLGHTGNAQVNIYNKLNAPLYINWDQSAIVLNDRTERSIKKNTMAINGSVRDSRIRWHRKMSSNSDSAKHIWSQAVTAIPSNSAIESEFIYLGDKFFERSVADMKQRMEGESVVYSKIYTQADSPLQFRSYLTISKSNDFLDSTIISNDFWVSEVSVTAIKPEEMASYLNRKNVYYIVKPTVATEMIGSFVILGIVGVLGTTTDWLPE